MTCKLGLQSTSFRANFCHAFNPDIKSYVRHRKGGYRDTPVAGVDLTATIVAISDMALRFAIYESNPPATCPVPPYCLVIPCVCCNGFCVANTLLSSSGGRWQHILKEISMSSRDILNMKFNGSDVVESISKLVLWEIDFSHILRIIIRPGNRMQSLTGEMMIYTKHANSSSLKHKMWPQSWSHTKVETRNWQQRLNDQLQATWWWGYNGSRCTW